MERLSAKPVLKQYIYKNECSKGYLLVFLKSITFWSKGCHITFVKLRVCRLKYVVIQF